MQDDNASKEKMVKQQCNGIDTCCGESRETFQKK